MNRNTEKVGAQIHIEPVESGPGTQQWSQASQTAFRFCFVYFGLFCFANQTITALFPIPKLEIPDPATLWPMRQIVIWTAVHIFRITSPLVYEGSGSGDKTFDWVLDFDLLFIAAVATIIWSVIDKRRAHDVFLYKSFRLFIRFALAGQMFAYGFAKAVPLQMPFPYLSQLLEPLGQLSPMGVLWASVGASPAYEIFAGCAEILGGVLLIVPRTTMFGGLICLADMIQVFMLNMTYDVPVKLFSFHLILLTVLVLSPDLPRLVNFFFLNRAAGAATKERLWPQGRAALGAQILFGIWLVGMNAYGSWQNWYIYGGGQPKSPLYGIWEIEQLSIDGQVHAPLVTDRERWRYAIFDTPAFMALQKMDGSLDYYTASVDKDHNRLALTKRRDQKRKASLVLERLSSDRLNLDGDMDKPRFTCN